MDTLSLVGFIFILESLLHVDSLLLKIEDQHHDQHCKTRIYDDGLYLQRYKNSYDLPVIVIDYAATQHLFAIFKQEEFYCFNALDVLLENQANQ